MSVFQDLKRKYSKTKDYIKNVATGKQDILPNIGYRKSFKDAEAENTLRSIYGMGADVVNSIGRKGIIQPINDLAYQTKQVIKNKPIEYNKLQSGAAKIGSNIITGSKPQEILANVGETVNPIINAYGGGKIFGLGKSALNLGQQSLKQLALKGASQGAKIGLTGGVSQGLEQGRDKTLSEQLTGSALSGVVGTVGGGIVGGVLPVATVGSKLALKASKSGVMNTISDIKAPYLLNKEIPNKITTDVNGIKLNNYRTDTSYKEIPASKLRSVLRKEDVIVNDYKAPDDIVGVLFDNNGNALSINTKNKAVQDYVKTFPMRSGFINLNEPLGNKAVKQPVETPTINSNDLSGTKPPIPPTNANIPQGTSVPPAGKPNKDLINLENLNISKTEKNRIRKTIEEVKPQIESKIGAKLTNQEAIDLANNSSKTLNTAVGREQTKQWEAALLKTRQKLAASAKSNTLDKDFIENLKVVKSLATDTARKLQSFGISADPLNTTPKQAIVEAILKVNDKTDEILKAAKGVDFNDARQSTEFYRQFIKPTTGEWLDLIRYNSMLSSPLTHIKNIATNAFQVGVVKPIEKTITGAVDIFAKNRTSFAGEGTAYSKGVLSNIGSATRKFADVMSGKQGLTNLDLKYMPVGTGKGVKFLEFPTKMLDGMDQFFTELARGGETAALQLKKSKGVKVGDIKSKALENASYTVFRDKLGNSKQGYILDSLDKVTGMVEQLRNSSNPIIKYTAKFTLPFVKTPMNIFKQGIEYSPAGFATTIGAKNVSEQVSKALIGSAVFGGAATLIGSGRLTWGEPINEKQRNEFRAAGMQPYAVKIGDKWVAYKYLGPLAFPLAMTAAIDYEQKQGRLDDTTTERILGSVARYGEFLADQSYAKSMGDLLKAVGGGESSIAQLASNYPQQLIPLRALGGWLARITDPYQRKVSKDSNFIEKQTQLLMQNIPGLSQSLETRPDTFGNPIPNQNRVLNAFSPLSITTENPLGKDVYQSSENKRAENRQIADLKKGDGGKTSTGKFVKKIGDEYKTFDNEKDATSAVTKDTFDKSGKKSDLIDGIYYYKDKNGKTQTKTETEYNSTMRDLKLTKLKSNDDYKGWLLLADEKLKDIESQFDEADPLTQSQLANDYKTLSDQVEKYKGYGGFKKGSSGSKSSKSKYSITSIKRETPKISLTKKTISPVSLNIKGGVSGRGTGTARIIKPKSATARRL